MFAEVGAGDMAKFSPSCGRTVEDGCCHGLSLQVHRGSVCCEQTCVSGLAFLCCECCSLHWLVFLAPFEKDFIGYWWEFLWLRVIGVISPRSQTDFITLQCTMSFLSLLLGKTALQAPQIFTGQKEEGGAGGVIVAANWGENAGAAQLLLLPGLHSQTPHVQATAAASTFLSPPRHLLDRDGQRRKGWVWSDS